MTTQDEPSWLALARKAVVATLVAFTVAGGVILAALADDHVTTAEWVQIALAVAGAIVGPVSVYSVRNATPTVEPANTHSEEARAWVPPT